jgi:hypothetical protein
MPSRPDGAEPTEETTVAWLEDGETISGNYAGRRGLRRAGGSNKAPLSRFRLHGERLGAAVEKASAGWLRRLVTRTAREQTSIQKGATTMRQLRQSAIVR